MKSTTEIRVRGYHTDFLGHVNHGWFVEFLEEARWAYLALAEAIVGRVAFAVHWGPRLVAAIIPLSIAYHLSSGAEWETEADDPANDGAIATGFVWMYRLLSATSESFALLLFYGATVSPLAIGPTVDDGLPSRWALSLLSFIYFAGSFFYAWCSRRPFELRSLNLILATITGGIVVALMVVHLRAWIA